MDFEKLDKDRQNQLVNQISDFETRFEDKESDIVDIKINNDFLLKGYKINKHVFQSDKTSSVILARWIVENKYMISGKKIIDMFCGGGIQGIVSLLSGAEHVTFVDISKAACENVIENLENYDLVDKGSVVESNLFENVADKAYLIIANPPFFPNDPLEDKPDSVAMCMKTEDLEKFYIEADKFASRLLVVHWTFAGKENDPEVLGQKFGWTVLEKFLTKEGIGKQKIEGHHVKIVLLGK